MENTDPEFVNFEIDTMWVFRGGEDPVEILKKFGKRVKMLHVDDFHPKYIEHRSFFDGLPENPVITGEFYGKYNIDVATDIGTRGNGYSGSSGCGGSVYGCKIRIY